ncbi:hypothetical protein CM240_3178 [Clostridium bornimense]|uniref:Uncharacterized protein n=1 Tax=Clostridium bornimense TaxID=1216932 RepID=W6SKC3_9CLOT|nr:hypothetical protein CM240_3178 [Clostridium bornimense]
MCFYLFIYYLPSKIFSGDLTTNRKWIEKELETVTEKYPIVFMANGTGVPYIKYEASCTQLPLA